MEWHKLVWHSKTIPRHAVILWLAIRDGLYTQHKLYAFGIIREIKCTLCRQSCEDRDHLFFSCPFSEQIWRYLCNKCNLPWHPRSWQQNIDWMCQSFKGKSLRSFIFKVMFAAAVYFIWRERNARIHHHQPRHACNVIQDIVFCVRAKINTLHGHNPSQENRWLQRSWGVAEEIFRH